MKDYLSALHRLAQDAIRNSADQAGEARGIEKAAKLYFQMSGRSSNEERPEPPTIPQITTTAVRKKKVSAIERFTEERRELKKRVADVMRGQDLMEDTEIAKRSGLPLADVLRVLRAANDDGEVAKVGRKYEPLKGIFK